MLLALCLLAATDPRALTFIDQSGKEQRLSLDQLLATSPRVEIASRDDEYSGRKKRYAAFLLAPVLEKLWGRRAFGDDEALLKAADGYVVSLRAQQLVDGRAYVAFDDLDVPGFEPVGPKRVTPGPFYLVWAKDEQHDLTEYPRPYQLVSVALASFEARFPNTRPDPKDAAAMLGYAIFKRICVHCHAVNREGGRVGPELNVPKSVTEYWSAAQIRAYVRDPRSFRYGNMPPNPQLSEVDLDHLIAYLVAMQKKKHDPDAPR
jgi:mono/diheme cytochrome c family protein